MEKYDWDKNLLAFFAADPEIADEFYDAFLFLRKGPKADKTTDSCIDIIYRNYDYLRLNEFCKVPIINMLLISAPFYEIKGTKTKIPVSVALNYTNAFYSSLPSIISETFKNAFNRKQGRLKGYPVTKQNRYAGHCITSIKARDYLIDFEQSNNIVMAGTITHEFGHLVASIIRNYLNPNSSYDVFSEVESYFPELLYYEYMEDHSPYIEDAILAEAILSNSSTSDAALVLNKFNYAQVTGNFVRAKKMIILLSYKWAIDKKYGKESFRFFWETISHHAQEDLPYVYSYLISIELLHIWHQDPNEAIHLYCQIINLVHGNAQQKNDALLEMGIIPSKHYSEYVQKLTRKKNSLI